MVNHTHLHIPLLYIHMIYLYYLLIVHIHLYSIIVKHAIGYVFNIRPIY